MDLKIDDVNQYVVTNIVTLSRKVDDQGLGLAVIEYSLVALTHYIKTTTIAMGENDTLCDSPIRIDFRRTLLMSTSLNQ
ncbi:hypothetical protein ETB97_002361 [Aspergillus alliaceus]|uniref:Uncharacterized protein n=1 Tax=Petromyces alliaceus TaxID=209559 RepID=A0A8H6A3E2_PETAA|nr:hypothetical protein ETB97_002361 [Aspergillus burnettii]